MDLEILEQLALADDRVAAMAQLLPGSEDHDYFRGLAALHAERFAEADTILSAWPDRHGRTARYERLRLRTLLDRVARDPSGEPATQLRDWLGVSHWHEAEVAEVDPTRPTRLAAGTFDGATLLRQAFDYDANLSQVTDEGLDELVATEAPIEGARRRVLLGRLGHVRGDRVVALVADDLDARASNFGSLAAHAALTLAQLHALAARRPELLAHQTWVAAVVQRMRPPATIDLELDREARAAYLEALWAFVDALPPSNNSLKVHVLWHALDTARRLGHPHDPARFALYLQLPRRARYVPSAWIDRIANDQIAQLGTDYRAITGLAPAGDDEQLVRDLLAAKPDDAERYAKWIERGWLDAEVATARLLAGAADPDRATLTLGPARAAALRDRVEIAWAPHVPTWFAAAAEVVLEVDVKHVAELVVKVFRVDPLAYFQHHKREVSTDLDLDGLAASSEEVLRFTEAPVRRVRRRIPLPACARAGTYIVDLIGNGTSSRAVIYKGRLRHVARVGSAGCVVTIVDEAGAPRPDARAWIGDREYVPDARGTFAVPFSTAPSRTPMLLVAGDLATVAHLDLVREAYRLSLDLVVEREQLACGRSATAIARVALACAGQPASLELVEQATWDVTLVDRAGVPTTKSQPLVLVDGRATPLEWPMGEDTASVAVTIRGRVKVLSEQRDEDLTDAASCEVATIHNSYATEALYLARTAHGWVVSALGKTGEPRAQRPVTISLQHRWAFTQLNVELATDAHGRVELGHLPGCVRIAATLGSASQTWTVDAGATWTPALHVASGAPILIPIGIERDAAETIARASLVELRANAPHAHARATLAPLASAIEIRDLAPGIYDLRAPACRARLVVAEPGVEVGTSVVTRTDVIELSRPAPAIAAASLEGDGGVRAVVQGATRGTRVHAIASRFRSAMVEGPDLLLRARAGLAARTDRARGTLYISGRELGDEYRYVLERRTAKRFPGLLLERPSLLLNPWARRTTTTDVAVARGGDEFARMTQGGGHGYASAPAPAQAQAGDASSYVSHDFLADNPAVLANLELDGDGRVTIARAALGKATSVTIVVDDPAGACARVIALPEPALEPRDLRLALALDPARHATQRKQVTPLRAGETLAIDDLATAKVHLVDSVERAHAYLLALGDDATLREFAFVTRWHALPDHERRERYSKYACHELHVFLYFKDRGFFDAVVKPYLAHKRTKTFVDHFLLGDDLARFLEPVELARLNAVELALLAHRLAADPALPRILGDRVAILPPDPGRDTRIIDALLGASALDGDARITAATRSAVAREESFGEAMPAFAAAAGPGYGGGAGFGPPPAPPPMSAPAPRPAPKRARKMAEKAKADTAVDLLEMESDDAPFLADRELRRDQKPMFRAADKTQEYAEHNWWHLTPQESTAERIPATRLWRELAEARGTILSPSLGLAITNFSEAMCALAVIDLPFVAGAHVVTPDGPRLTIVAAGHALAGTSQLVDGELVTGGPPLVVGQNYVRTDDRYDYATGEQVDKYVTGALSAGVVYTCQVVLANPSSSRQRVAALVQIPRGSLPVGGAKPTQTIEVVLEAYGTHGHEYAFYFPVAGRYPHFPVHVTRDRQIVAAAPARPLDVVDGVAAPDPGSWSHVSQHGTTGEVVAYLAAANLAATDLDRAAWRLRDRAAYDAITSVLEARRHYRDTIWGYALLHADAPRIRAYLRAAGARVLEAGPVVDSFAIDAEDLGAYEHLEYAPLVNARAHRLGAKHRILNDGFAAQYAKFLDHVAHRTRPSAEDLLAATSYLLAQDRYAEALAMLARVTPASVAERMQHDYLAAFAACLGGDPARARELAIRWRELPVDRWRRRFEALLAMLDEVTGARAQPAIVDPTSQTRTGDSPVRTRDQQQAELAATQPAFELAVDRDGVLVRATNVDALELRYFEMDVELLFSRQPFVASDVSRFSFIEPGHRERLTAPAAEQRVAWSPALAGKNVVVEAVGAGTRKAKVHYANDLATTVANQYGQVRVQRASDQAALPATYVKVYARKQGGNVAFYKDGYTDLRGWFDYASLSTTDLDDVERFAILVCSDAAGAAILEAPPPAR